jgi:DNA-binding MarR family transcriptional regulator
MELGDLFVQFIERYRQVTVDADKVEMEKIGFCDLTLNQFYYLRGIQRNDRITLTELAQKLGVSKPSANAAITKLMKDGFVVRTQSDVDQRKFLLSLSEKGYQVFKHKQRVFEAFIKQIEKTTTENQQKTLTEAFRIMIECSPEKKE